MARKIAEDFKVLENRDMIYDYIYEVFFPACEALEKKLSVGKSRIHKRIDSKLDAAQKRLIYDLVAEHWQKIFISTAALWCDSENAARILFEYFEMSNSKMFHKENNPEYKNHTFYEIYKALLSDLDYCSDRMSWDRLFRIQWLYLNMERMTGAKWN